MKKKLIIYLLFLSAISSTSLAYEWEIGFRVFNSLGPHAGINVKILSMDPNTKVLENLFDKNTNAEFFEDCNQAVDRYAGRKQNYEIPSDKAYYDNIPLRRIYILVVDNDKCIKFVFRDNADFEEPIGDFGISYNTDTKSMSVSVNNSSWVAEGGVYNWEFYTTTLNSTKPNINFSLNNERLSLPQQREFASVTFPHSLEVFPAEETNCTWRGWFINGQLKSNAYEYSLGSQSLTNFNNTITAKYGNHLGVTVTTNMNNSVVDINFFGYSCPTNSAFFYDDDVNVVAGYEQDIDNFVCTIDYWKLNGVYHSNQVSFQLPAATTTNSLHAVFKKIKLSNSGESLYFGTNQNGPITLYWSSNPKVTSYKIWRHIKMNGVWQPDYNIATVSGNTNTYEDQDYKLNAWKQGIEIEYDVRGDSSGYYTQDPFWAKVYGSVNSKNNESLAENILTETEVPADYSISNYPNPFNPTTIINYQLPKDGIVSIKVYDVLGKEVAALVNEQKSAGYYKVEFNGNGLTSGLYICSIQAGSFSKSIKLMLTK